jgi:hypothetical protein
MIDIRTCSIRFIAPLWLCFFIISSGNGQKIAGPVVLESGVAPGYTLFAPLNSKTTYLIDNCGRVINSWESEFFPGNTAYLLPNGNLLRAKRLPNEVITGGGGGGGVELFDWDSNLLWTFELNNDSLRLHHDIAPLPNGNVLMIVWELRTEEEALQAGRNPSLIPTEKVIWSEQILEVKPIPPASHEIVWKWSLWDHLIQDFDNTKPAFGIVSDHPERVDINYLSQVIPDWIHANSIDYHESLDQIIISSPFFNEFWIIDHSTTTAEAATHEGGVSNKGGDLLYRWGNPLTYKRGTASDQRLFGQHDVHWIEDGPHSGKVILFNNNKGTNFSSVEILDLPLNSTATYDLNGQAYGPEEPDLIYTATPKEDFFSQIMAGAQALPNGNLLICSSRQGIFFEVTPANEQVWLYKSPVTVNGIVNRDFTETDPDYKNDLNFRAVKYGEEYPAFTGRDLTPSEPIEGEPWACPVVGTTENEVASGNLHVFPNPAREKLYIRSSHESTILSVKLLTLQGQVLLSTTEKNELALDVMTLPDGIYFLQVNHESFKIVKAGNFK